MFLMCAIIGFAQTTNIPDTNFEHYLETHSKIDLSQVEVGDENSMGNGIDGDHLVTTANISARTSLYISRQNISDLTGIEDFTSLTDFYCSFNNITVLKLPSVSSFANLDIEGNKITTINFPDSVTSLGEFTCQNNDITSINLNNITYINYFIADNNELTSLDLSNTDVEGLNCSGNPDLESIDLRNGADYSEIYEFRVKNSPKLSCIYVDNVASVTSIMKNGVDADLNFVTTVAMCNLLSTHTYVPDNNFEQALIDEGLDDVLDDYVLTTNISTIGFLDVSNKNISDLTGIEDFVGLETLSCENNQLTTLDLSNNHILEFSCSNNQLTSLILNADARVVFCNNNLLTSLNIPTSLANLDCSNNNIISLDLSSTTELSILNVSNNNLTFLDFRNGENAQISSSYDFNTGDDYSFDARNNTDLTCIFVDDAAFSTTNWKKVDATSHFVENQTQCDAATIEYTYVPDDNFEQVLIDAQLDDVLDDYVLTDNIKNLTFLNVSFKNISDLTGIEDFVSLVTLSCTDNSLTSLDVTKNTSLTYLKFSFNQISTIDVSQNVVLEQLIGVHNQLLSLDVMNNVSLKRLEIWENNISSLDLSKNVNLEKLYIDLNPINTIDISKNTNLKILSFGGDMNTRSLISSIDVSKNTLLESVSFIYTQIESLDVSHLTNLSTLLVRNNRLTDLDVSQNTNLTDFVCNDNQLKTLNIKNGNNINIWRFNATNNWQLNCIEVDDPVWSTTNWTSIDNHSSFGDNCHYLETYVPDDNFEQALVNLGYDAGTLDDYVVTANIIGVTSLDISSKNISDLTGLEDFKALVNFNCNNNNINSIDLSGNQDLQELDCSFNQIVRLDFYNNINLRKIYCNDNQLTAIESLHYQQDLTFLDCSNNSLNDVFVGNNSNLEGLYTSNNQLTYIDVSSNLKLTELKANQNLMTSLNVKNGNNTNFTEFTALNNPNLTCIFVDNDTWSMKNWPNIDATSNFVENEAACNSLSVSEFTSSTFKILSNPVKENIFISIDEKVNFLLSNINGEVLKRGELIAGNNTINVSKYAKGVYFLRVHNSQKTITRKIIIN